MTDPTANADLNHRAAALAAAYLLHDLEGNDEGVMAVLQDAYTDYKLLGSFIRGISRHALEFGRTRYGSKEAFVAYLRNLVLQYQSER